MILLLAAVACRGKQPSQIVELSYKTIEAGYNLLASRIRLDKIDKEDAQSVKNGLDEAKAYVDELYAKITEIRAKRGPLAEPTPEEWNEMNTINDAAWHAYRAAMKILEQREGE
jgi:hypothetical protein